MKAIVFTLLVVVLAVSALIVTRPEVQAELQVVPPTRVLLTQTRSQQIFPATRITGRLKPSRMSNLQFEVSGKLVSRYVEPGQAVTEGMVLLEIDAADLQDALHNASASLEEEQAAIARDRQLLKLSADEMALLNNEVQRIEKLGRESLSSQSRSDEVRRQLLTLEAAESRLRYSVNTASARLKRARAAVNIAERNLQRAQLLAPFSGRVNSVHAEPGDYVTPGQVAIRLVQVETLDLALEAPENVASALHSGQAIEVKVGNETRDGILIAKAVDPSPQTLTYALRIRISADGAVPGQLAEARLPGRAIDSAILVPRTAILREEGGAYVFVVQQGSLLRQPVEIRMAYEDDFVIQGLASGVSIVAKNVAALADAQQVVTD